MLRAFLSGLSAWFKPGLMGIQPAFNPAFTPSRVGKTRPRAHAFSGVRVAQRAAAKRRNRRQNKRGQR